MSAPLETGYRVNALCWGWLRP